MIRYDWKSIFMIISSNMEADSEVKFIGFDDGDAENRNLVADFLKKYYQYRKYSAQKLWKGYSKSATFMYNNCYAYQGYICAKESVEIRRTIIGLEQYWKKEMVDYDQIELIESMKNEQISFEVSGSIRNDESQDTDTDSNNSFACAS